MNQEFRYPGLASFTTAQRDLFFGRKRETRELFHLISVEKTVALFSKSGLGKTSLLNAGVIPLLAENRIWPVPIRFGTDLLLPEGHFAVQLEVAHQNFMGKNKPKPDFSDTFWQQLKNRPFLRDGETWTPLLIFDQFEELFTLYPQPERRTRFVQELADLIQERLPERLRQVLFAQLDAGKISPSAIAEAEKAPPLKIVFSIRSDMLHFMDELSEQIPYILRSRYQLFGLSEEQAREAIVAPAALPNVSSVGGTSSHPDTTPRRFVTEPFGYTEEALREIIGVLTKNREVESFQLQAVCQALEEKMLSGQMQKFNFAELLPRNEDGFPLIAPEVYGGTEGIGRILEESYQRRLDSLEKPEWTAAAARLLEDALVNENGRRRSVDVADLLARPGVTPDLLDALERQRLVRKEPRLDSFYYEISHDTLLAPIVKSRRAREAEEEKARVEVELANERRKRRRAVALVGVLVAGFLVATMLSIWTIRLQKKTIVALDETEKARFEAEQQRQKRQKIIDAIYFYNNRFGLSFQQGDGARLYGYIDKEGNEMISHKYIEAEPFNDFNFGFAHVQDSDGNKYLIDTTGAEFLTINKFDNLDFNITGLDLTYDINGSSAALTKIPNYAFSLYKLKVLLLRMNNIEYLPSRIKNLVNLEVLILSENNLKNLPPEIGYLKKLRVLDIGDTELRRYFYPRRLFPSLVEGNQLSYLPPEIGGLVNLEYLDLRKNNLTSLPAEIQSLKSLKWLFLQENPFPPSYIEQLRKDMPWCEIRF